MMLALPHVPPFAAFGPTQGGSCRGRTLRRRADAFSFLDLLDDPLAHPIRVKRARRVAPQPIRVDISETPEAVRVQADVEGFSKDEVSLRLEDKVLIITAEHRGTEVSQVEPASTVDAASRSKDNAGATVEKTDAANEAAPAGNNEAAPSEAGAAQPKGTSEASEATEAHTPVRHLLKERRPAPTVTKASRSFRLPAAVDADSAEATFEDGVLSLLLPKTKTVHQIAIQ